MSTSPHQRLHHVTVDGVGIAVAVVQVTPSPVLTLVWVHGLGGASTLQFAQAARHPALANVTSLLIDLPGFGRSSRPGDWGYTIDDHAAVVLDVIPRIADGPMTLFGHSMGGSVAILCAERAPAAFRQLILAEPNVRATAGPMSAGIAAQTEAQYVGHGHEVLLRATRLEAASGDPEAMSWLEAVKMAAPVAMHRSAVSLVVERTPSFGERLEALDLPRAMILGEASGYDSRVSGVTTHVVPNARHGMMVGNPEGFVTALVAALGPITPPRAC